MKTPLLAFTMFAVSLALGCASNNSPAGGTGGAVGTGGATATGGSGAAGTTGAAGAHDGGGDGPLLYTLTVQNYLAWCDITENGTVYPASVPPVMSFAPGTVVNLNAVPNSIFVWGYWTGTDGDKGAGHDTSMSTMVTMTSNKTVVACCPDPPPAAATCP